MPKIVSGSFRQFDLYPSTCLPAGNIYIPAAAAGRMAAPDENLPAHMEARALIEGGDLAWLAFARFNPLTVFGFLFARTEYPPEGAAFFLAPVTALPA